MYRILRGIAALSVAALLIPITARGGGSTEDDARRSAEQARLERVRAEIQDLQERLRTTQARAGSVLDTLEEIDLRQALLRREAEELRQEERQAMRQEAECRDQAAAIAYRIQANEADLRRWMVEAYKAGPSGGVKVLWVSATAPQFAAARRALEALSLRQADDPVAGTHAGHNLLQHFVEQLRE